LLSSFHALKRQTREFKGDLLLGYIGGQKKVRTRTRHSTDY
jgi:hypothetical protein